MHKRKDDVEEEINYNRYNRKPNIEEEMKQSIKLFREELFELIRTYLNPFLK